MGRREVRALIPSAPGSACHLDIPCTITRHFTRWNKGRLQQAGWDLLECLNIGERSEEGDKHAGRHVAMEDDSSLIKASHQDGVVFCKQYTRENTHTQYCLLTIHFSQRKPVETKPAISLSIKNYHKMSQYIYTSMHACRFLLGMLIWYISIHFYSLRNFTTLYWFIVSIACACILDNIFL